MISLRTKKKIVVASVSNRVIDDSYITKPMDTVIGRMVFNNTDMGEAIKEEIVNNPFGKFRRYLQYGKTKYTRGCPTAVMDGNTLDVAELSTVLESITGNPGTVEYAHYTAINPYHVAWKHLTEVYGYDPQTNTLGAVSAQLGAETYVNSMTLVYPNSQKEQLLRATELAWSPVTKGLTSPLNAFASFRDKVEVEYADVSQPYVRTTYVYRYTDPETALVSLRTGAIESHPTGYDPDRPYYQVKYVHTAGTLFWVYDPALGTYPTLDGEDSNNAVYVSGGQYFPIALFRSEGDNLTDPALHDTDDYKTTKALLKTLGLDYQELSDSIHENEDVDQVQQAALMMALPITSQEPEDMNYLFQFFDGLYERTVEYADLYSETADSVARSYILNFQEGSDYTFGLTFDGITRKTVFGSIGEVGTYTNTVDTLITRQSITTAGTTLRLVEDQRVFRYQVTAGFYYELRVSNPKKRQVIYKSRSEVADFEDDECLIPLDFNVVKHMRHNDRGIVLQRSLRLVFNSADSYYIKWYQTKTFSFILIIAAIIITIATGGTASGPVATALAALGVTGIALTVLTILIQAYLIQIAVKVVARKVSPQFAMLLAVVATIASFGAGNEGILSAANLLQAANGLAQISTASSQYRMDEARKDYAAEQERQDALWEELESVNELLDTGLTIDPYMFIALSPTIKLGESPEDYFSRTIHSGNIGTLGFEYIHNYHDLQLQLPTTDDTLY